MSLSDDTHLRRWLGRVPDHWSSTPLKYLLRRRTERGRPDATLLSVYRDHGVVPKDSRDDNFNRVGKDLEKYLFVRAGDLVINKMKAWQGSVAVSQYTGIVSPAYFTFAVAAACQGRFLHYLLRSTAYVDEWKRLSAGVRPNQWDLDIDAFGRTPIPLPSPDEQRAIADFLDRKTAAIDALVEKKERLIALLEEKRQALITQAVTKGLDPNVPMKDSGIAWLGEIPALWQPMRVKHLVSLVTSGSRGWAAYYADEGAVFLQSGNLDRQLGVVFEGAQRVLLPERVEGTRTRVCGSDVLVCITGALTGNVGLVEDDPAESYINQHLALVRPKTRLVDPFFLALALAARPGQDQFLASQYGGTKQGLGLDDVKNVVVALPPLSEQRSIAEAVRAHLRRDGEVMRIVREQQDLIREYRQAIITSAVTGKLAVSSEAA